MLTDCVLFYFCALTLADFNYIRQGYFTCIRAIIHCVSDSETTLNETGWSLEIIKNWYKHNKL